MLWHQGAGRSSPRLQKRSCCGDELPSLSQHIISRLLPSLDDVCSLTVSGGTDNFPLPAPCHAGTQLSAFVAPLSLIKREKKNPGSHEAAQASREFCSPPSMCWDYRDCHSTQFRCLYFQSFLLEDGYSLYQCFPYLHLYPPTPQLLLKVFFASFSTLESSKYPQS